MTLLLPSLRNQQLELRLLESSSYLIVYKTYHYYIIRTTMQEHKLSDFQGSTLNEWIKKSLDLPHC